MESCKICQKDFERLAPHVLRAHNTSYESYLLNYIHGGVNPKCECGCGLDVPFSRSQGMRFLRYIHGHSARIEGRLTNESKAKIGEKNRKNLVRFYGENKDKATNQASLMRAHITPEVRKRSAKTNAENWQKPESVGKRKLQSSRACDLLEQGKIGPQAPYRTEWKLNPFTGREEYMHSSWETRFLDECIERNIPVTKQHGIRIPYVDPNGVERVYIPDFLTLDRKTLYEVKGHEIDTDREKWRATMTWCIQNEAHLEVVRFS
jgi:hypothetical protein